MTGTDQPQVDSVRREHRDQLNISAVLAQEWAHFLQRLHHAMLERIFDEPVKAQQAKNKGIPYRCIQSRRARGIGA